ncbi:MAG: RsmD family RNA methyltransferase [Porphyromonadaceae bacterium]|nr:RsmD family RNA methyltransferase [Porphyromonadaceae bacterium]
MRIISGKYGRRRFEVPPNIKARPTTDFARENLFNVLQDRIDLEGAKALDLFAGTGAISFELASRGCSRVVAVENYPVQYRFIRKVAGLLQATEILPIKGDVFRFVPSCREKFDFIFADPHFDLPQLPQIVPLILENDLLNPKGIFVLEHPEKYDFSALPAFEQQRIYGRIHFSFFTARP